MSKNLSAVARTEFDSEVKQAYQKGGLLRDRATVRAGVVGDTYKFRKIGKGMAQQRPAPSSLVTPMDVAHELQTATLTNWYAPEYTDIFDAAEVNFDEQSELARVIGNALGRRCDQLIIDALEDTTAASLAGDVNEDVGGTNTGLNTGKVRRAARHLNEKGVENANRTLIHTAQGLENMLSETAVTSSDYNTVKALVNGELDTWVGFKFVCIETRDEGGLPAGSSNETLNFAFHKDAVGLAVGIEPKTSVDWIAERRSWLSCGDMKAGAVARDLDGIVQIQTYTA